MVVTSARQMKQAEEAYVASSQMDFIALMEQAGSEAAQAVLCRESPCKTVILCGSGNNGGDGLVMARLLSQKGFFVTAALPMGAPKTPQAKVMLQKLPKDVLILTESDQISNAVMQAELIVDAVFGIGFHGCLPESLLPLCHICNDKNKRVYAVDLPSGANADTGEVESDCFHAICTITFASKKRGHYLYPCAEYCGDIIVCDIGISQDLLLQAGANCRVLSKDEIADLIPDRKKDANKGTFGKLLVVAGSRGMAGAAAIACKAALHASAGLVTLAAPNDTAAALVSVLLASTMMPLAQTDQGAISSINIPMLIEKANQMTAVAIGCGISVCEDTKAAVFELIRSSEIPMVLDADALNLIAQNPMVLLEAKAPLILTPHPGEMARLTGQSIAQVQSDRISAAQEFAKKYHVILVLKGAYTVIASDQGNIVINPTGNSGLSRGGSGDMLTGIIGAMLCQSLSPMDAAVAGVYLHGLAADCCAEKQSQYTMLPTDVIDHLSDAFLQIKGV